MPKYSIIVLISCIVLTVSAQDDKAVKELDPANYYWLEQLEDDTVLNWVRDQNQKTQNYFKSMDLLPRLADWWKDFNEQSKWITVQPAPPHAEQVGPYAQLVYGSEWIRADLENYLSNIPIPLFRYDINNLIEDDESVYEYEKVVCRGPEYTNCLVYFKKKDRRRLIEIREFDTEKGDFVQDGFHIPAANTQAFWRDANSIYITTNSTNPYAMANKLRLLKRGEPLEKAEVIYSSDEYDVRLSLFKRGKLLFFGKDYRYLDTEYFLVKDDKLVSLNLPRDLKDLHVVSGNLVVQLTSAWEIGDQEFPPGSLIAIKLEAFLNGDLGFQLLTSSSKEKAIDQIWATTDILVVRALEDVQSRLIEWTFKNGQWDSRTIAEPSGDNISVMRTQDSLNRYYFRQRHFIKPLENYVRESDGAIKKTAYFERPIDTSLYHVSQRFAKSKDGTRVPYFMVHKKGLDLNGMNPVIMTGYGGWGNSQLPFSLDHYYRWVQDGGIFVLANIRGGGEYGPEWHLAAVRENRHRAFEDFHAVAENLIELKVTSPKKIGIYGGSNSGLLVCIAFIQKPELYGAVLSRMGSLELQRCSGLRGVKPTGERGDGAIQEDWAFMQTYSPFHNLEAGQEYPPVLVFASRGDDISHPCHSRKFVHRMNDLGYRGVYFLESEKGGHGRLDVPNRRAMELAFFYKNIHPLYNKIFNKAENKSQAKN